MLEQVPARPETMTQIRRPLRLIWPLSLFVVLWVSFFILYRSFPYVKNGSDVVFAAKLRWEASGQIFPAEPRRAPGTYFWQQQDSRRVRAVLFRSDGGGGQYQGFFLQLRLSRQRPAPPAAESDVRARASPRRTLLTLPWRADPPGEASSASCRMITKSFKSCFRSGIW